MIGVTISMSGSDIAAGGIGTVMAIGMLFVAPRAWRGYFTLRETRFRGQLRTHGELSLVWWPFGKATLRGAIRSFVVLAFWWCGTVVAYWASVLSGDSAGSMSHVYHLAFWVFAALSIATLVLVLPVLFFNWPKFIVPPPQRDELGAVAEWRRARRASTP